MKEADCICPPAPGVPDRVAEYDPGETEEPTIKYTPVLASPSGGGVTGLELKLVNMPLGSPETCSCTAAVKSLKDVTVACPLPEPP